MKTVQRYGATLRIYDNGGKTFDRFTCIPPRGARAYRDSPMQWQAIGSSENPFSPQGFGMTVTACPGTHLGARIPWDRLPVDVQRFARDVFPDFCPPKEF